MGRVTCPRRCPHRTTGEVKPCSNNQARNYSEGCQVQRSRSISPRDVSNSISRPRFSPKTISNYVARCESRSPLFNKWERRSQRDSERIQAEDHQHPRSRRRELITCNLLIIRSARRARSPQCPFRQYKYSTNAGDPYDAVRRVLLPGRWLPTGRWQPDSPKPRLTAEQTSIALIRRSVR
jgi:hypothetical protein